METLSKKTKAMHIREAFSKAMHITKSKTFASKAKPNHKSTSKSCLATFSPAIAMETFSNSSITHNISANTCASTASNFDTSSKPLNSNSSKPAKHAKKGMSSSFKKLSEDIKAKRKSIAARHQLLAELVSSSPVVAALRYLSVAARRSASRNPKNQSSFHGAASTGSIPLSDDLTTPSPAPKPPPPSPRSISIADPVDSLQIVANLVSDSLDLIPTVASPSTQSHVSASTITTRPRHYALFAAAFLTAAFVIAISAGKTFALALTGAAYMLIWLNGKLGTGSSDGRASALQPVASEVFRRSLTVPHHRTSQLSPSKLPDRSNSLPLASRFAQFCVEKRQANVFSSVKPQVMLLLVLFGLLQGKTVAIPFVLISMCLVYGLKGFHSSQTLARF